MRKLLVLGSILCGLVLTACNEKIYTVEDFSKNKELRNEYRKKCENGELSGDHLNCQNSFKAVVLSNRIDNASWD